VKGIGAVQEQHVQCGYRFRAEPKRWIRVTTPVLAPGESVSPAWGIAKVEMDPQVRKAYLGV
jgi:hypothetical protein